MTPLVEKCVSRVARHIHVVNVPADFSAGPVVHSNCVAAVASLAVAVSLHGSHHERTGDEKEAATPATANASAAETTGHLGHAHWFRMVADTLLCTMAENYRSAGRTFVLGPKVCALDVFC